MVIFQVVPYPAGAGQLLADGSIDWSRGGAILTLSTALAFIPLGPLSAHRVRQKYNPVSNPVMKTSSSVQLASARAGMAFRRARYM